MYPAVVCLVALALIFLWLALMLRRNGQTLNYRLWLLDEIYEADKASIDAGRNWKWRHKAYNLVDYSYMSDALVRPLDSYYNVEALLAEQPPEDLNSIVLPDKGTWFYIKQRLGL